MRVRLTPELYEYLLKSDFLGEDARSALLKSIRSGDNVLDVPDETADAIRDACGERLQQAGFDHEYKPTKEGVLLEQLIDKFRVG
jgi:hypothetical protein